MIGATSREVRFAFALPDLAASPPADAPTPPDPFLMAAERVAGEADGHARGYAEGLAEGARRQHAAQEGAIAASLAELAAALASAADSGASVAVQSAEALAATLFTAMDAALGEEPAHRGAALADQVATALRPALADQPEVTIRAAPELVEALTARLPDGPKVIGDGTLAPGEARAEWRDGARLVSPARRRAAVRAALLAAGFHLESDAA